MTSVSIPTLYYEVGSGKFKKSPIILYSQVLCLLATPLKAIH